MIVWIANVRVDDNDYGYIVVVNRAMLDSEEANANRIIPSKQYIILHYTNCNTNQPHYKFSHKTQCKNIMLNDVVKTVS